MASELVKVITNCTTTLPVLELANESVYVKKFSVNCVILGRRGEELCHYK